MAVAVTVYYCDLVIDEMDRMGVDIDELEDGCPLPMLLYAPPLSLPSALFL